MRGSARATSSVAALLLVILSFGVAGAAYADPGAGNGNDGSSPSNGNAYGADNGTGSDNGNAYGADNGSSATSDAVDSSAAAATSGASSTKSDSSTKSSSTKGSSTKGSSNSDKSPSSHQKSGTAGTSGTPPAPQPISGADDNTGGANGQCPGGVYCGTVRDKPSMNGNGTGKATGKPCAGCVGKADNKNPQGQKPNARDDGNNGYECDGNNGIAKGNPAHTTCVPGPVTPPPPGVQCPPGTVLVNGVCVPPPGVQCPPGTVLVNGVCVAGEEEILCPDGSKMPESGVCPKEEDVTPPTVTPPTVLGDEALRPPVKVKAAQAGVLPATGSSPGLGLLAGVGFTMLALGAGVMMRRRTV